MLYFSLFIFICLHCFVSTFAYTCEPLSYRTGVTIHCEIAVTRESIDCQSSRVPVGTVATYNCENHYVTTDGLHKGGTMKCGSDGEWTPELPFRGFSCHVECGAKPIGHNDSKWPWQAGIYIRHHYVCAGTLISPFNSGFIILTAANCLLGKNNIPYDPKDITVLMGLFSTDFESSLHGQHTESFSVKNLLFSSYDENGIALIQPKEEVVLGNNIIPACFSTNEYLANQQLEEGNSGQLVGFGEVGKFSGQAVLRSSNLRILPSHICQDLDRNTVCAGIPNSKNAVCDADSGAGLLALDTFGKQFIQGVLPKGTVKCQSHSHFIKTIDFAIWIRDIIPKLQVGNNNHISYPGPLVQQTTPFEIAFQIETERTKRPTTPKYEKTNYYYTSTTPSWNNHKFPGPEENFRDYEVTGLEWHNLYRRKHNTPEVILSHKLNQEAKREAELSATNNRYKLQGFVNWFGIVGGNLNSTSLVREAIKDWYRTGSTYDTNNPVTLPFTQIIWKNTKEIGIGIANQGDKQIVVVKYNRPLIIEGEQKKSFQENVLPTSNFY